MATIKDLSPSAELKARLAAAFPDIDVDVAPLQAYVRRPNLTDAQKSVVGELEQLAVETVNE